MEFAANCCAWSMLSGGLPGLSENSKEMIAATCCAGAAFITGAIHLVLLGLAIITIEEIID